MVLHYQFVSEYFMILFVTQWLGISYCLKESLIHHIVVKYVTLFSSLDTQNTRRKTIHNISKTVSRLNSGNECMYKTIQRKGRGLRGYMVFIFTKVQCIG